MADTADSRLRSALLIYFPMFIATLSLLTSIYNGYLNNRFVDLAERNTSRTEYLRTCKEVIDAYFQVKLRITALSGAGEGAPAAMRADAASAVARLGALGTYLANLRDEAARERYTRLTAELEKLAADAPKLAADELIKRFDSPEQEFYGMNSDCVKSAKNLLR